MHPTSNFMGHYLIAPLAARGITCLGLNSRFAGNDTVLLMERVLQDLGAGVKFMRDELGCERVVLVGNSGGAALAAYYQAEAEHFSAETMVDGDPTHSSPPTCRRSMASRSAPRTRGARTCCCAGSILRSSTSTTRSRSIPALDMYDPTHWPDGAAAPPRFDARLPGPLRRRAAGAPRPHRGARARPARRAARDTGRRRATRRSSSTARTPTRAASTSALDANDRRPGSVWGDARAVNYGANAMGRTTSLTAFLSQWSSASRAGGPENLATHLAAGAAPDLHRRPEHLPEHARRLARAPAPGRIRNVDIVGGDHYLAGRVDLQKRVADEIAAFAEAL